MQPDSDTISTPGLRLRLSDLDGAMVVRCHGQLLLETSDFLKREVKSRMPEKGRIVLDLTDVTRMDSSGLGALVALYLSARGRSCAFELINLNKQIRDLLALSNLLSVFDTYGRHGVRMP